MHLLEQEIIKKIKLGDRHAFEYLFKSYYALLCHYAFDLLKNEETAKEAVQEILIKIWENKENLNISASIRSYLYRSVHNQCLNWIKHNQVIKNLQDKYYEEIHQNADLLQYSEEENILEDYFYDGLEHDLKEAVQSLPEQCRIVFKMSRFDHLRHDQISQDLNISVNTVKTQIGRALEKIRLLIREKIEKKMKDIDI